MADANIPPAAMEAMAMFPLPGIVLFPGALMPLHIFEPRYRKMLADCIEFLPKMKRVRDQLVTVYGPNWPDKLEAAAARKRATAAKRGTA